MIMAINRYDLDLGFRLRAEGNLTATRGYLYLKAWLMDILNLMCLNVVRAAPTSKRLIISLTVLVTGFILYET